jgi:hypothetical protein
MGHVAVYLVCVLFVQGCCVTVQLRGGRDEGEEKGRRAECVYDVQTNGMNVIINIKSNVHPCVPKKTGVPKILDNLGVLDFHHTDI